VLRAGAAYVPVDVDSPAWRAAYIFRDCGVRVAFVSAERKQELASALASPAEFGGPSPHLIAVRSAPSGEGIRALLPKVTPSMQGDAGPARADDLAYVLYTSGSTGQPKGVVLPHRAGTSFIDWCSTAFNVREDDRFSSHAPFHFDLSILDLFLPIRHTATVVLFDAAASKEPVALARSIATHRISIWYSTPSILTMLAYYGKLSDHEYPALRTVLFAGEVFPVKHLRALKQIWTTPGFYNLYGPTETNVCTWHMIPDVIPAERSEPYPIGALCAHCRGRISDETGAQATRGEEGELCIAGPAVMNGYWNQQALTDAAIRMDADGTRWYRTGDVVVDDGSGILTFVGRRDRMIKRRGYRIELGEIETMLHRYPRVEGVAAVAHRDANGELRIVACLHCAGEPPGTIAMKQWCAEAMPAYMIPDRFLFLDALPTTSTDKIDYQRLLAMV
jgi:amino acid adenylation domain-containing protein